jgi:diguanylate cyclase (GGDEF)-like protein/PAS domain S-box-containing protein
LSSLWLGLLSNTGIVALFITIWANANFDSLEWSPSMRRLAFGVFLGFGAITVMLMPFAVNDGIYLDLRLTLVAVAGLFGGPAAAAMAAIMAASVRAYEGGVGTAPGITIIATVAVAGIAARRLNGNALPSVPGLMLFSLAVAASSAIGVLGLPRDIWALVIPIILGPMTTIYFVATLMASLAIGNELRRREASRKNHMYQEVIDTLPDCLNVKDRQGRFIIANPATAVMMKADGVQALIGSSDFDFYPREVAQSFKADEEKVWAEGMSRFVEQHINYGDGDGGWVSTLKTPLLDEAGRITGLITHNRDITSEKLLQAALVESERKAAMVLSNMADGIVVFDQNLNLVFCNEQYRSIFAMTADLRVPGTHAAAILHASISRGEMIGIPTNVDAWIEAALSRLLQPGTMHFSLANGRWIESRTSPSTDGGCIVICSDITKSKQDAQALNELNQRLAELAETDGLTGLLNRRAFDVVATEAVDRVDRGDGPLSLLLLDVDRFKAFNDAYGHPAGDDCLRAVADCVRAVVRRQSDRSARYGGEEMVLILPNTSEVDAIAMAFDLRERIRSLRIAHAGSEKGIVTASIGVATLTNGSGGLDAARLVGRADEALYVAKASGRDVVRCWQPVALTG